MMMLFKTVFVFDRAQVDPIDGREQAPLGPPCEPLTGDSHAHLIAPMLAFAEALGFTVSITRIKRDGCRAHRRVVENTPDNQGINGHRSPSHSQRTRRAATWSSSKICGVFEGVITTAPLV
ncbi:MAG: hypothetical protein ACLPZR_04920 [Solirubrobacteraceae bacterium]